MKSLRDKILLRRVKGSCGGSKPPPYEIYKGYKIAAKAG